MSNFTCAICANYEIDKDKCLQTCDTVGSFRADRTCCGVESWHITRKNNAYSESTEKVRVRDRIAKYTASRTWLKSYDDRETGLEWLMGPDEDISFSEAELCMSRLGYGWRFPNTCELYTLHKSEAIHYTWRSVGIWVVNQHSCLNIATHRHVLCYHTDMRKGTASEDITTNPPKDIKGRNCRVFAVHVKGFEIIKKELLAHMPIIEVAKWGRYKKEFVSTAGLTYKIVSKMSKNGYFITSAGWKNGEIMFNCWKIIDNTHIQFVNHSHLEEE